MKKIKAFYYTKGHYGKRFRETVDTDNEYLYSRGRYPTKIKKEDLPEDYIEFRSRAIWYMIGYLKTSGVVDIAYKPLKINHLFKDDYLYISYKEKLKTEKSEWGSFYYINYDIAVCGSDIVPILLYIEKYSNLNIDKIKGQIYDKVKWFYDNFGDMYSINFPKDNIDIFEYYKEKMFK